MMECIDSFECISNSFWHHHHHKKKKKRRKKRKNTHSSSSAAPCKKNNAAHLAEKPKTRRKRKRKNVATTSWQRLLLLLLQSVVTSLPANRSSSSSSVSKCFSVFLQPGNMLSIVVYLLAFSTVSVAAGKGESDGAIRDPGVVVVIGVQAEFLGFTMVLSTLFGNN